MGPEIDEFEGIMSDNSMRDHQKQEMVNYRRHPQFELNDLDEEQGAMWEKK